MELTAMHFYEEGIRCNALDDTYNRENLEANQRASNIEHKKRLEVLTEQTKTARETKSWGIAMQVFSWIASLLGIITGIALIATGVGAVAGAFLICSGVIVVGSQILEVTGGWGRIAKLLPDDSPEKKAAIINWIQLALTILGVIMGVAGGVMGGFAAISESMQFANALFGGIVLSALGITQIGKAIKDREGKRHQASVRQHEIELTRLENEREDTADKIEEKFKRMERLSDFIRQYFSARKETHRAVWR
jgi:hypothetical protein